MKKIILIIIIGIITTGVNANEDVYSFLNNHKLNNKEDLQPGYFHHVVIEDNDFQKLLSKEINNLPIYFGTSKDKEPFNSIFPELIRNHSAFFKEIEINDEIYFINSGCRFQSCGEKGYLWIDKKNKIVLGANIHYFFNDKDNFNSQGDLLIFSKTFSTFNDLPKEFKNNLNNWLSTIVIYDFLEKDKDKQMKPFIPKNIRFLNSQNELKELNKIK